jgi:hypothetical protein
MGAAKVYPVADAESYVVMLAKSGQGEDSQWFDYKPSYFSPSTRIEWDTGTMFAALPAETAAYLVNHRYARPMTEAEVEAYTAPVITTKSKKEKSDDPS